MQGGFGEQSSRAKATAMHSPSAFLGDVVKP